MLQTFPFEAGELDHRNAGGQPSARPRPGTVFDKQGVHA